MSPIDLFGKDTPIITINPNVHESSYQRYKRIYKYKKSKDPVKKCLNCVHMRGYEYHDRIYYKCKKIGVSNGAATDIRLSYVCTQFLEKDRMKEMIMSGKICPYCLNSSHLVDSKEIYGKSYGLIYLCRPCDAWVGVHKGTKRALGRMANAELRDAKKQAHFYFDKIARTDLIHQVWSIEMGNITNRTKGYLWLADSMEMDPQECHIGMFDVEQCNKVVELCKPHIK